jgi:hypothetical protein
MIQPYSHPVISAFKKPRMIAQAKAELRALRRDLRKKMSFQENEFWIWSPPKRPKSKSNPLWTPKLYVCVAPQDYWRAVRSLIDLSQNFELDWKFCKKISTLSRPDKIVIYFKDEAHLKRSLPKIRKSLKGFQLHAISHAASTVKMKLEKSGKGLYVGADPSFLKTSWRFYRCLVLAGISNNRVYFHAHFKNKSMLYRFFNLSERHEGPLNFRPRSGTTALRKLWKELV